MSRIPENEIYCCEIRWFGVDKNGYIFCCTAGGTPNIPEFVCCDSYENWFLEGFFVFEFNKKTEVENFQSIGPELNLKGITTFDIVLEYLFDPESKREFNDHKYEYKKVAQPTELLHFDQLPKYVQKMMDSHRMNNVDVTKTDYFFVPANPNY